jgi:hypothetical protein
MKNQMTEDDRVDNIQFTFNNIVPYFILDEEFKIAVISRCCGIIAISS